ncbi:hypothetical protein [Varibaculum cambriense]|uniref:hypothetical protein n=1 Tax=Varibaculum cambriense TaxID=184870 RepID=UPI0025567E42|nr:hypothetical protein [Varibaculum cambriense]MDK8275049.1 hypothetical protein [Varibaculum cambriense]MDU5615605.1 hypothetical protein [Varibaculum cambriense]MDU7407999.1 hypothetical protein [Varibaculum cambriense]
MASEEPRLLNAAEVSERLGGCRSKAYQDIRELNAEMRVRGCKVMAGRVSNEVFEETFFRREGGARRDR